MASPSRPANTSADGQVANDTPEGPTLIEETIALWQPYSDRKLTAEDARQMIVNIVGFFDLLNEWDLQKRKRESEKPTDPLPEESRKR